MPFIYKIENIVNRKIYVGMTLKSRFERRKGEHLCDLRKNKHFNSYLQNAWNKYGEENFVFEILEEIFFPLTYCKEYRHEYTSLREIYLINLLGAQYNLAREVRGGGLGRIFTQEQRDFTSRQFKGRKHTEETKNKIKESRAKQVITQSHKDAVSKKMKGNKYSVGRTFSKEITMKRIDSCIKSRMKNHKKSFTAYSILNENIVYDFNHLKEAQDVLGIDMRLVHAALNKSKTNISKGYYFKYKEVCHR